MLRLLVAGKTDREIAEAPFISRSTASRHKGAVPATLAAASRAEAVVAAVRRGLA